MRKTASNTFQCVQKGGNIQLAKDTISNLVIRRLPRYYRFLGDLDAMGITKISSRELSERMGLTASQIRQDLNCFGGFGQQGYGYNIVDLRYEIGKILGLNIKNKAILIGAGNLGKAIASHINFDKMGFSLAGIFDKDPDCIGTSITDIKVSDISELEKFCKENKPQVAILCIPKNAANHLSEQLIDLGITAFWNFSHYDFRLSNQNVVVENVHLGDSLMVLSYNLRTKNESLQDSENE